MTARTGTKTTARWVALPLVVASAGLALSTLVAPAQAAAPEQAPVTDTAASASATLSPAARALGGTVQEAIDAYWTPERMASAVPADLPDTTKIIASAADKKSVGTPGTTAPAATPADAMAIAEAAGALTGPDGVDVNASPTVGRVFFYNPNSGKNSSCSGAALNSASKRLVITAGHCVHGGQGKTYMQNWVFVPYYNYGARPYGTFSARTYRTFDSWRNSSSYDHDIAMVTTWSNEYGQLVVNAVGGNGLSWNYSRSIYLTILAYPAEYPFDGQWQQYCRGTTERVGIFDGRIQLKCGFTGGSSGGPWFRAYSDSTRLGYSNGVMSTLASGGWNRSPYFDDKVKSMYDATAGD